MRHNTRMTITQFDIDTNEEIDTYTGTLKEILDKIENYHQYYFRITALGKGTVSTRVKETYFGVKISSIGGLKQTEADYLNNFLNYIIRQYNENEYLWSFWDVINHDLWYLEKMEQLSQNSKSDFTTAINNFLAANIQFTEISNLNTVQGIPGIYLLILDEYNVCYIGQSKNIRKRIMEHWSNSKYFSGTGIDLFKAKDTTRIYVFPMINEEYEYIDCYENVLVNNIPKRFTLNILTGGSIDYLVKNNLSFLPNKDSSEEIKDNSLWEYMAVQDRKIKQNECRFIVI